jgi:hypothetical protein
MFLHPDGRINIMHLIFIVVLSCILLSAEAHIATAQQQF